MELRHLITFKTIVETGGFKKAADELGYAQSSVTSHIKELENELGHPLFDRLGKRVVLTQVGKRFLPYAIEIINLYSKSKDVIQETGEPAGELTIGASESIMIYWLPDILKSFREKYAKVDLKMKAIDYKQLSSQLKKGDIDVAILVEKEGWNPKELTIKKVKEERLSYIRAVDKINHTIPETMFLTEYSCSWRPMIEDYLKLKEPASMSKIELPSVEAIKKCVLCGLGLAMLPYFTVVDDIHRGELEEVELPKMNKDLSIYTVCYKGKWLSNNLQAFFDVLDEHTGT
ncbi:LysR family transcriptional regulator [Gracilibacillus alcaliphilus]|uniref:LysR family transcriptional regulator n=1 Tax=Gracilibacillus alcaliphilus TaxID=1401441 RepID=UPI00195F2310|nr:LysR family transcriptional regulator [Gracilibacillus alcaliphilus]MBM7677595.1 DNA-binding transcriptional LysR family regulator [Gracilibacillus alcaliphilus]